MFNIHYMHYGNLYWVSNTCISVNTWNLCDDGGKKEKGKMRDISDKKKTLSRSMFGVNWMLRQIVDDLSYSQKLKIISKRLHLMEVFTIKWKQTKPWRNTRFVPHNKFIHLFPPVRVVQELRQPNEMTANRFFILMTQQRTRYCYWRAVLNSKAQGLLIREMLIHLRLTSTSTHNSSNFCHGTLAFSCLQLLILQWYIL